jgi:FKBP-type peptidyl-prolyl cis-trans isomerase
VVTISYTVSLADGTKIDSSVDRGQDLSWRLGDGSVIPGLDSAVSAMRVGSHARVTIPPEQAYGEAGSGADIPPNSTLIYDIRLSSVR